MKSIIGALLMGLVAACAPSFDESRDPVDRGTFGTTVVTLACKRVAYLEDLTDGDGVVDVRGDTYRDACRLGLAPPATAPAPLRALLAKRDQLVDAVDTAFPEDFLPDLQTFLTSDAFLSLYDSGQVVAAVDDLVELLRFFADDDELAPTLARLAHRVGYLPARHGLGGLRAVANYPGLHELLRAVTRAIAPGGHAKPELDALVAALGVTLRNAAPSATPMAPDRIGRLGLDLLLSESPLLGGPTSLPLVRRDHRGVAAVAMDATGNPIAPFVDADADGLADVDELGHFVDANGVPLATPAPFEPPAGDPTAPNIFRDPDGRALASPDGAPLYAYVDLDRTLLAALSRDAADLFDPDRGTALDLFRGASALMSTRPRVPTTRHYESGESLDYLGYDATESPLLDMMHGYLSLLTYPDVQDVLDLLRTMLLDHEPETARLLESLLDAKDIASAFDDAHMDPRAPFADALVPVVRDILAVPGLAEDLMLALEDPALAHLDMRLRDYLLYSDRFTFDADQNLVGSFATPVDRAAPDAGDNRSLLQRLMHLIADADGATLCNKQDGQVKDPLGLGIPLSTYDECELIRIDNVALLYVQSLAYARDATGSFTCRAGAPSRNDAGYWRCPDGSRPIGKARLELDWNNFIIEAIVSDELIEAMTTIHGFTTSPTPEALTRALFLDPMPAFLADVMDPGETKFGERFIDVHDGTLPVFEADGGYDQLQPLVQPFADHDAEHLFLALMAVFHEHWPSRQSSPTHQFDRPGEAGYVWGANAVSYEPAVIAILERGDGIPGQGSLLDALRHAAPVLNHTRIDGRTSIDILTDVARFAFRPRAGLANRRGATSSHTIDGQPIPQLSPVQLILDAYAIKRDQLAAAGAEGQAWQRAIANVADVLLRGEPAAGGGWRFANPRLRGVSTVLLDFLADRVRAHDDAGDRASWLLTTLPDDAQRIVGGPVFAGAADFAAALHADPEARRQLELLVVYLMSEASDTEAFRLTLFAVADLLQLALDDRDIVPIAHVLGEALRLERGWLDSQTAFVRDAVDTDATHALSRVLRHLFDEWAPGRTALGGLVDGIAEIHRVQPYDDLGADYAAADYRALLRGLADFVDDEKRGLRRFIAIVETRHR